MDPFTILAAGSAIAGGVSSIANFGLGLMNYDYQKNLQNKMFQREDTSIARRVADLKASGLSPVLAAGQGAGSGPVVSTHTPELKGLSESSMIALNILSMEKDFAIKDQQLQNLQLQADNIKATTFERNVTGETKRHDLNIYKLWKQPSNSSQLGKTVRDIVGGLDSPIMKNAGDAVVKKVRKGIKIIEQNKQKKERKEFKMQVSPRG